MTPLPIPSAEAITHSNTLTQHIASHITQAGGWIDFATFMHLALYMPSLGYYSGGSQKFAHAQHGGGDFVTAPQLSPLFAHTLCNQIVEVFAELNDGLNSKLQTHSVLELGAGTGKLAVDVLLKLAQLNALPQHYFILEVSDHLRQVQLENLQKQLPADLFKRVEWLNSLPENFVGVMIGNEVLDAIPVHLVHQTAAGLCERGVVLNSETDNISDEKLNGSDLSNKKLNGFLQTHFSFQDALISNQANTNQQYLLQQAAALDLPENYITELCPAANGLIASMAQSLQQGAILLIDYGFSVREYYHPQRNLGTLMCHYQQLAHTNPLVYAGLQDITAHINFTAIAEAGCENGLALEGFCSQAQFLMNCGILTLMAEVSPNDIIQYAPLAAAAQKLLSPAEMGDLFKVIGFSKALENPLMGFARGDKSHTL